ncbi:hypothetical protein BU23DRAFT_81488 [Bimuria novae-zelandiae CBS 107.79]|uniref:Uncharacterized protein n=1 Tax=Bimuria novae-zelandiae CBS 107.79 TaxID=1447943 RepID=A0A6A5VFW5_9PLEO|nr:hypothetical protein BU23DRAFT_81488 [Bimuria novae-zelandiae CBS 107.79]
MDCAMRCPCPGPRRGASRVPWDLEVSKKVPPFEFHRGAQQSDYSTTASGSMSYHGLVTVVVTSIIISCCAAMMLIANAIRPGSLRDQCQNGLAATEGRQLNHGPPSDSPMIEKLVHLHVHSDTIPHLKLRSGDNDRLPGTTSPPPRQTRSHSTPTTSRSGALQTASSDARAKGYPL